jgi:hypothetical protein
MVDHAESTIEPTFKPCSNESGTKSQTNWARAAFFFLLGFVLLSEPLMLALLLYKNGTL